MLNKVAKALLPRRVRNFIGLRSAKYATRIPILGPAYLRACWGIKGLKVLGNGDLLLEGLTMPWDALPTYINVSVDKIYDKFGGPGDGDTVIDVGAYVGISSVIHSSIVGATGKVIAVEPSPDNLSYLEGNIRGTDNIVVYTKALSDKVGKAKFYLGRLHAGFEPYKVKDFIWVETTTLDNLASELEIRPNFIKINTAFSVNMKILQGAPEVLSLTNLMVVVYCPFEIQGKREGLKDILDLLGSYNFKVTTGGICIYAKK